MKQQKNPQNPPKQQLHSYWLTYSKQKKRLILFHGDKVLDLTDFASLHPAGEKAISTYHLQDVKNILFRVYPHPAHTLHVLERYCVGRVKDYGSRNKEKSMGKDRDGVEGLQGRGIFKDKSNIVERKQQKNKKVSFDTHKQQLMKIDPKRTQKAKKQHTIKQQQNPTILQQNKPNLFVPHFDVRFDCFQKIKIQIGEDS